MKINYFQGDLTDITAEKETLVQIWGEGNRAGVYPMAGGEVYWFVTVCRPTMLFCHS